MNRTGVAIGMLDTATAADIRKWMDAVVVGVGTSPTDRTALAWATREAKLLDTSLVLCHVHPRAGLAGIRQTTVDIGEGILGHALATASHSIDESRIIATVGHGDPARVLALVSAEARMLVLGSHGYFSQGGLFPPLSMRIAAHASCPLVVHPLAAGGDGPFRGHVVVGVDGSAEAREALAFGYAHAAMHHRPLTAVNVSAKPAGDFWTDDTLLETQFTAEPPGETLLATEVEPWEARYPGVPTKRAVYGGRPAPGLLRAAAGADLLVVGDRGRGLAARALLGSVAQEMLGAATCPVAVVRATEAHERS